MALAITTLPTSTATVGTAYSSSVIATGGTPAYAYASIVGTPPIGLTLNTSTGAIAGTPTTQGIWTFELQVTDSTMTTATAITSINVSGGSPPPSGYPVAAHTFSFVRVYLSTRSGGPPGTGGWTNPVTIFDGTTNPTVFNQAKTFSAGALGPTDLNGIVSQVEDFPNTADQLAFLGNGLPTLPLYVNFASPPPTILSPDYWDTSHGAWNYGGAFYIALIGNALSEPDVFVIIRSTDNGATWALQDAANSPSPVTGDGSKAALQRVNNKICVFTLSSGSTYGIWEFDLTTNTWGAEFASVNIPNFLDTGVNDWSNGLHKFLNGNYLVLYDDSVLGPVCRLWNGTSWAAPQVLPGASIANSVMDPGFGIVYIFTYGVAATKNSAVHCSTFTLAGSVLTPDVDIIPAAVGLSDGVGHGSVQNGMLFVPRDDFADFVNAVWVASLPITSFHKEFLPIPAGETNAIVSAQIVPATGTGYAVGDTGTVDGGATGFLQSYIINAVQTGALRTWSWTINGTGYVVGDTGHINASSPLAEFQVTSVDGSGGITGLFFTNLGGGLSVGNNQATTADSGVGVGFEINVLSTFTGVSQVTLNDVPSGDQGGGYSTGIHTTTRGGAQPGAGSGLEINIIAVGGKNPSCAYMMFPNGYLLTSSNDPVLIPVGAGAAFSFSVPSPVTSAKHTLCVQSVSGGGTLTDVPYIVRSYAFSNEKFPPDIILFLPWSDLNYAFDKIARNLVLDVDTGSVPCTVQLQADGATMQTFTVTSASNDRDRTIATNSNLEGRLFRLTFTPGVGGKAQVFSAGLDYVADVNSVSYLDTYWQDFGWTGFSAIKQAWIVYQGSSISINFLTDGDANFYTVVLPASATRITSRFYLPAISGGVLNKAKLHRIQVTGVGGGGFRLYAGSLLEVINFGSDQRGSFSLVNVNAEMQLKVAQMMTGAWPL